VTGTLAGVGVGWGSAGGQRRAGTSWAQREREDADGVEHGCRRSSPRESGRRHALAHSLNPRLRSNIQVPPNPTQPTQPSHPTATNRPSPGVVPSEVIRVHPPQHQLAAVVGVWVAVEPEAEDRRGDGALRRQEVERRHAAVDGDGGEAHALGSVGGWLAVGGGWLGTVGREQVFWLQWVEAWLLRTPPPTPHPARGPI
jgi:hypothetical protein